MIDLTEYGLRPEYIPADAAGVPARVTAVFKERYTLITAEAETHGRLKSSVYFGEGSQLFPTTGDFVMIAPNPLGDSVILQTLPRRTFFSRRDPYPGRPMEQAVAANFDTAFLVLSLNENFNLHRLERYLTLAWQSGARPVVVLTKADLPGDHSEMIRSARETALGVEVLTVSSVTGEGLEALAPYLGPGQTVALLGSSGVGKSSLVNKLAGEELMATGAIRERDGQGRHTTTHRQLLKLPQGALVIDTPGMRELGMWDVSEGLNEAFQDVERFLGKCRFSDCRHESEPGCAIQEAIRSGALSPQRWETYKKLQKEAVYDDSREAYIAQKTVRNRALAMAQRQRQKHNRKKKG